MRHRFSNVIHSCLHAFHSMLMAFHAFFNLAVRGLRYCGGS